MSDEDPVGLLIGTARAAATVLREIESALEEAASPKASLARHTRIALARAAERAAARDAPQVERARRTGEWTPPPTKKR